MTDFQPGDKVVCIDDQYFQYMQFFPERVRRGHLYVIEDIRPMIGGGHVVDIRGIIPRLDSNGILPGFKSHRFKKVGA